MSGTVERVEPTKRTPVSWKMRSQHLLELVLIGGEVELGVSCSAEPAVEEEEVDAEVAGVVGHVVDAGVAESGRARWRR